jgi:hypothetical protein
MQSYYDGIFDVIIWVWYQVLASSGSNRVNNKTNTINFTICEGINVGAIHAFIDHDTSLWADQQQVIDELQKDKKLYSPIIIIDKISPFSTKIMVK